jgi:hypothetical protein
VNTPRELGIADQSINEDVDAQAGELRNKHERVVRHVVGYFILMAESRQRVSRVSGRGARSGCLSGKLRNRFSGPARQDRG